HPDLRGESCDGAVTIPAADIISFAVLAPDYGTGKTAVDIDGATVATTSSTTVTLHVEAEGAIHTSLDPYARVDSYYQAASGNWIKVGTATGVLRQTSVPQRFYTYTFVFDPDAAVPVGAVTVVGIGVEYQGT